jgi:hypothetical protein
VLLPAAPCEALKHAEERGCFRPSWPGSAAPWHLSVGYEGGDGKQSLVQPLQPWASMNRRAVANGPQVVHNDSYWYIFIIIPCMDMFAPVIHDTSVYLILSSQIIPLIHSLGTGMV